MKTEFKKKLRKVGSKDNPSFVIPVEKETIKENKINTKKKVNVRLTQ